MNKLLPLFLLALSVSCQEVYQNTYYYITNANSVKVLEVCAYNTTDGAYVDQYQQNDGKNQKWYLQAVDASECYYMYSDLGDSLVLDANLQGVTSAGDEVSIWKQWGGPNQQWRFSQAGGAGFYYIQNCASNLFLQVSDSSTSDLAPITLGDYTGGKNQQWMLTGDGTRKTFGSVIKDIFSDVGKAIPVVVSLAPLLG